MTKRKLILFPVTDIARCSGLPCCMAFKGRLLFVLLLSLASALRPVFAERYALLIGVGEFPAQGTDISLPGIDKDLQMMRELMLKLEVPPGNITQLHNAQATTVAVVRHLIKAAGQLTHNDQLFLYISTHGGQIKNTGDDHEADGFDEFLAFYDLETVPDATTTNELDLIGILRDDDFGRLLAGIRAKTTLIIDSCASASAHKSLVLNGTQKLKAVGKFLTASWLRSADAVLTNGEEKPRYDTAPNLLVMAAAQDYQEAAATDTGSSYTTALSQVWDKLPVKTAFCWHKFAYSYVREVVRHPQKPELTGAFNAANQSLIATDKTLTAIENFNQCFDVEGETNAVSDEIFFKTGNDRSLRLNEEIVPAVNLQLYVQTAESVDRLKLRGENNSLLPVKQKMKDWAELLEREALARDIGPDVNTFLAVRLPGQKQSTPFLLSRPGWANSITRYGSGFSSAIARLK